MGSGSPRRASHGPPGWTHVAELGDGIVFYNSDTGESWVGSLDPSGGQWVESGGEGGERPHRDGTDPDEPDTDGDGVGDGEEIYNGSDPNDPNGGGSTGDGATCQPGGTGGWVPGAHHGVLDPDLFAQAQRSRAINQTNSAKVNRRHRHYSLSGLAICGHCGGPLHFHTSKGGRYRVYCYQARQAARCGQRSGFLDGVEAQAAAFLRDLPAAWEAATPDQRNALGRTVFQSVEITDGRVAAVVPQPDFAPFFNLAEIEPNSAGNDERQPSLTAPER